MLRSLERRRMVRWQIERPVRFKLSGDEKEHIAMLKDISFTGARLSLLESLRLNDKIDMVMEIPDEENSIPCQAKVVWQNTAKNSSRPHFFCGLNFVQIRDHDKERIFNYVWKTAPEDVRRQWWGPKK